MTTSLILLLIIILIIIHFTKYCSNKLENFKNNSPAILNFMADDILHVYHLKHGAEMPKGGNWYGNLRNRPLSNTNNLKYVGSAFCCNRVYKMKINNYIAGDRILFYYRNTGGPGYIAGHVFWNGNYYPTNNTDYSCSGIFSKFKQNGRYFRETGKRLGCYKDGPNRRLRFYAGSNMTNEKCRDISIARSHRYYGMQYGGECWTDNNIYKAKSYGRLNDNRCNMRGKNGMTKWTQRQGGGWANDLYDTKNAPILRHCGRANKAPIHRDAFRIKSEQGPNCAHNELGWVEIMFKTEKSNLVDKEYCPDPRYTEFNAAACENSTDRESCMRTPLKGFTPSASKCVNIHDVSHYDYNNKDFYNIVSSAVETNSRNISSSIAKELYNNLIDVLNMACSIKSIQENVDYTEDDKCQAIVKEIIEDGKNSYKFFGIVNEAVKLSKNPKLGNQQLSHHFNLKLKELIKNARRINFISNKKTNDCSCPSDQYSQKYKIIKENHECRSKDKWLGWKKNINDCAEACDSTKGCKYFIYGKNKKKGRCYWEKTKSDKCKEGWERDDYDFAKVDKRKCGPC